MNRSRIAIPAIAIMALVLASTEARSEERSDSLMGVNLYEGASAVFRRDGASFDGVSLSQYVGVYRRVSRAGYIDLDFSANLNLGDTLPGAWFGVHPDYRHFLAGPLYGTAGLDLFWNPKHVDAGAHAGLGVRFAVGRLSIGASVLGATTIDNDVFELRGTAGLAFAF